MELTVGSHLGGVMTSAAVHEGAIYVASNLWPAGEFNFDETPPSGGPDDSEMPFAGTAEVPELTADRGKTGFTVRATIPPAG